MEHISVEEEDVYRTNVVKLAKQVAGDYDNASSTSKKTSMKYREEANVYKGETKYVDSIVKKKK